MTPKAEKSILAMLNAFPQSKGDDPKLTLATYRAVLNGAGELAIARTAERYVSGTVERQDLRFAPSVAEFCKHVRDCEASMRHAVRPAPLLVPARRIPPTPEQAARVHALAARVRQTCEQAVLANKEAVAAMRNPRIDEIRENHAAERAERWQAQAREELERAVSESSADAQRIMMEAE